MSDDQSTETLYSFAEGLPRPPDRRSGLRYATLLRVGVLETGAGKELCLIRNISAGGLMAHVYSKIPMGTRASIELKTGQQVSGTVVWGDEANIGLQFDEAIDVAEILTACSTGTDGRKPRMPRIEIDCFASVRVGALTYRARTCDVSQGGVKLLVDRMLSEGEAVVTMAGFRPIHGVIRWCDGKFAGVGFNQVVPLPELIGWLKQREQIRRSTLHVKAALGDDIAA